MNTPAFPTAIPHDDSKALSAGERLLANLMYIIRRDRTRELAKLDGGTHTSPVSAAIRNADNTHTEVA